MPGPAKRGTGMFCRRQVVPVPFLRPNLLFVIPDLLRNPDYCGLGSVPSLSFPRRRESRIVRARHVVPFFSPLSHLTVTDCTADWPAPRYNSPATIPPTPPDPRSP